MDIRKFMFDNFGIDGGEIVEKERDGRVVKIYCLSAPDGFDSFGVQHWDVEVIVYVSKYVNGREQIVVEMWSDFELEGVWGVIEEEYRFKNRFRNGLLRKQQFRAIEEEILRFKKIG